MGIRFSKSINLGGGARINLSKNGFGYSIGANGARITRTSKGRTRTTLSIPNTGLSYVTESSKKKNKNTTKKVKENKTIKVDKEMENDNMLSKFNLTENELELLNFVVNNVESLNEEFSMHDISCKGCVISNTYYNKLYDKGLFLKPSRGKYSLNVELLEKLAKEKQEKDMELERIAKEKAERKMKNKERNKKIFKVCFIPMMIAILLLIII